MSFGCSKAKRSFQVTKVPDVAPRFIDQLTFINHGGDYPEDKVVVKIERHAGLNSLSSRCDESKYEEYFNTTKEAILAAYPAADVSAIVSRCCACAPLPAASGAESMVLSVAPSVVAPKSETHVVPAASRSKHRCCRALNSPVLLNSSKDSYHASSRTTCSHISPPLPSSVSASVISVPS